MDSRKLVKINCIIKRDYSPDLIKHLKIIGIKNYYIKPARCSVLREKRFIVDYRTSTLLEDYRTDYFIFYVPPRYESSVIKYLGNRLELNYPGKGSIFSIETEAYGMNLNPFDEDALKKIPKEKIQVLSGISGIYCIVQRGEGRMIAKAVLERGICVPVITHGTGMGLRKSLGLLRITINRDKDIVYIIAQNQDALETMNIAAETAGLDYPGKGFIYMVPLRKGVLDTKIYKEFNRHIASMEQIITAIDELKHSAEWRRKTASFSRKPSPGRGGRMQNLVKFSIICNEGESEPFINTAMAMGAGGATLTRLNSASITNRDAALRTSPAARELSTMIIPSETADRIIEDYMNNDFLSEKVSGLINISKVEKTRGYRNTESSG